jgi:hypothetical protein
MSKAEALAAWPNEGLEAFNEGDTVMLKAPENAQEAQERFVIRHMNDDYIWFTDGQCCRTERFTETFALDVIAEKQREAIAIEGIWLRYNQGKIEVNVCVDGYKWITVIEADTVELLENHVYYFAPVRVIQQAKDAIRD